MLESQITLILLGKSMSSSLSKKILKVLNKGKWIEIDKVIYCIRNYKSIKITNDHIKQNQLVNDSIQVIKIKALKISQRLYKWFYDSC